MRVLVLGLHLSFSKLMRVQTKYFPIQKLSFYMLLRVRVRKNKATGFSAGRGFLLTPDRICVFVASAP
jgi:hypothetical protein